MINKFSSAGLLYVYINGYEDNGKLLIQQYDTYRYIEEDLYCTIMEKSNLADEDEKYVHVFAIVGSKDKADSVISIFENEMKANFQKILANKKSKSIHKSWIVPVILSFVAFRSSTVLNLIIFLREFIMIMVILCLALYVAIACPTKTVIRL